MAITLRGSTTSGSGDTFTSSKTTAVPTGSAIDDVAVLTGDVWTAGATPTVTWPSGFTEITAAHTTAATGDGTQHTFAAWKRLTAADSGNYSVSFSATVWNNVQCSTWIGCLASGDPVEAVNTNSGTSGTTIATTAVTVATLALLLHFSTTYQAVTATPPVGWTELQDSSVNHLNYQVAALTGTYTATGGTYSASSPQCVALIAIKPATSGTAMNLSAAAGSGAAQSLSLAKALSLGAAAGTGTPQAVAMAKALSLDQAAGSGAPQPMSFTKAPILGPAAGSGAAQAMGLTGAVTMPLGSATGTGAPQPMSFTKGLTLGPAAGSGAPRALTLSKALGLQNAAGSGAAQSAGFTAAGSMPFGTATGTGTPQPMSFSKAWVLSPATGSGAVQAVTFSKSLQFGPAAGSGAVLELSSSKLLTLDFVAGTGTSYPMIFAPLVGPIDDDLGPWLTLGDLMDARATHEQIMLDVISVRHPGMIEAAFDPDLGYAPATQQPSYYTGKATVQARQISAGVLNPAGLGTLTQLGYAVHGPVGSTFDQVAPGDIIVVTDSADPLHAGKEIVVKNVESSSFVTARRVVCVDYQPTSP